MEISLSLLAPPPPQAGIEGVYHHHLAHVLYLRYIYFYVCVHVCVCVPWCVCESQRTIWTTWALEVELRSTGLAASTLPLGSDLSGP